MVTFEYLVEHYDYVEGWLVERASGQVRGWIDSDYVKIRILGVRYYMHHLVFMWHHGYMPEMIDHVDRNGFHNRIENLRECTRRQNQGNMKRDPMHGIEHRCRKYRVRMSTTNGKIAFGSYDTLEEAIEVRDTEYRRYFGEFYNG